MRKVRFVNLGCQYEQHRDEILAKFDEISRAGAYILSDEVARFEENFARLCGTRYALGVGNGSDALYLCLKSLGIGPGDEVITAPNSFIATAGAIARTGARPVFSDVGPDMNLDPERLAAAITSRTKALLPVHFTGRVAPMDAVRELAESRRLPVIEDAAQAVGARYREQRAGSFGRCAGFSLHPLKNLHVHGDGGVITTDDPQLSEVLRKQRNHGLRNRNECEFWGVNSRLDAIQAGIANIKLPYLDAWNSRFRQIAQRYTDALGAHVVVPRHGPHEEPVYHRYMIRHPDRDGLQRFLLERGIETAVHYPIPLHLQPAAASLGYQRGDFPVTESLADTILSLPLYSELEDAEVDYVIDNVIAYCKLHPTDRLGDIRARSS